MRMYMPQRNAAIICPKSAAGTQNPRNLLESICSLRVFSTEKNDVRLPGKPDIVLPKYKTVIFVNGCFGHAHEGCKYFVWPKTTKNF